MRPDHLLRTTVAGALSLTARVLVTVADVTTEAARRARPEDAGEGPFGGRERATEAAGAAAGTAQRPAGGGARPAKKASAAARRARAAAPPTGEPAGPGPVGAGAPTGEQGPPLPAAEGRATQPADVESVGTAAPAHARTYDTHAAQIADRPAAQVIAAVGNLSTDELRQLYEHEVAHKRRRTVLQAIEAGLAPPTG